MQDVRNWNSSVQWKYPIHRRIFDIFDDTKNKRFFDGTRQLMYNAASVISDTLSKSKPKVINHKQYVDIPTEVIVPRKKKTIIYEDVEVVKIKKRYKVKKVGKVKTITIPNIKIKWNLPFLKKVSAAVFIVFFPLLVVASIILGSRMVYITNGDLTAEIARYKVEERVDQKMAPYTGAIDNIKNRVDVMENNQLPIYIYQVKTKYRVIDKTTKKPKIIQQYETNRN